MDIVSVDLQFACRPEQLVAPAMTKLEEPALVGAALNRRRHQREFRDIDVEERTVLIDHPIGSAH